MLDMHWCISTQINSIKCYKHFFQQRQQSLVDESISKEIFYYDRWKQAVSETFPYIWRIWIPPKDNDILSINKFNFIHSSSNECEFPWSYRLLFCLFPTVLFITHLFHPDASSVVKVFLDGNMGHSRCRIGTMPVSFTGLSPDYITGTNFLNRAIPIITMD